MVCRPPDATKCSDLSCIVSDVGSSKVELRHRLARAGFKVSAHTARRVFLEDYDESA